MNLKSIQKQAREEFEREFDLEHPIYAYHNKDKTLHWINLSAIEIFLDSAIEKAVKQALEEVKDWLEKERIDGHFPLYSDDFDRMFQDIEEKKENL